MRVEESVTLQNYTNLKKKKGKRRKKIDKRRREWVVALSFILLR